jgi:hypothetical protein
MDPLEVKYTDPKHPGAFTGADKFYRSQSENSRKQIKKFLSAQEAYTLHKPVRYRIQRNRVVVSSIDSLWDIDLMQMTSYREDNDSYSFILVCIDILSHFLWTRALKTKTAAEVTAAFKDIFSEARKPRKIRSDRGGEFTNSLLQKLFKKEKIGHFFANNEGKANFAERVIRTVKLRISRYFTYKQTHRWIDILSDVTEGYNSTYHRTIKRTPASVNIDNAPLVWETQYGKSRPLKTDGAFIFPVNGYVRITHLKRTFQREYDERWTTEVFKVKGRSIRAGLNLYTLEDFEGESIMGQFYQSELQLVTIDPSGVFKIDQVLKTRKRKGRGKEFLIQWRGWPAKFNSWVNASDMEDV